MAAEMSSEPQSAPDEMEENILYDLTIAAEWPQEPETINRNVKEKAQISLSGRLSSVAYRTLWTFLRSIGIYAKTASPCSLPIELVKLVSSHINWHLAVSPDGRNIAVLQDQILEIRSSRDEFISSTWRCAVSSDPYPQWRTVVWSPDADMVAYSESTGAVHVLDIAGTSIVYLPSTVVSNPNSPVDLSHAVVGLIFKEYQGKEKIWHVELLVINYQGALHSYLIGLDGTHCLNHKFVFGLHYPRGLSSALYLPDHSLLVLGGPASPADHNHQDGLVSSTDCGITLWRSLSDSPHYKIVTDYEQDLRMAQKNIMNRLKNWTSNFSWRKNSQDGIYALSLSPNKSMLAAIHYSGRVSVWQVPSLRLAATWPLEEQPGYDEVNPEIDDNPRRRKFLKDSLKAFNIVDADWWSEEAMILVRGTGALTVSSGKTLRNLLGTSPEWFEPAPVVSPAIEGGFMALECESKLSHQKRRHVDEDEDFEDSDDELDHSMVTRTTRYIRWVLHYVTDIERFQPPRKRPKVLNRIYRLVNLKSTTPEELYHRKIEHEEYGEALALAKLYGLDCDLVYQRQWRKAPVSIASIQDYLSKISKRSWVLNDCCERVPANLDAMRELLQYGLRGTDLEALIAIGNKEDGGRFILCDVNAAYEESIDYLDEEALEEAKETEAERRRALAATVDFDNLSLEQKELCRARVKFLQYLDRLGTYEEILGGIYAAEERYDPKFFEEFRSKNIVELAVNYARQCDWRALDVLFIYHGRELLQHRLPILSNFPETFPPMEYRELLPEAGSQESDPEVLPWEEREIRSEDWVEMDECKSAIDPNPEDPGAFLYEENSELSQFRGDVLTRDQLCEWYKFRASQIERESRQVEHALKLISFGMERYVHGLEKLSDDLLTMDTLVYDCYIEDSLTFEELSNMKDIDKLRLIMSKSAVEMYAKNVRRWLVPFLHRCEKHEKGSFNSLIRQYLVSQATEDLTCCRKVFESSKADQPNPVITDDNELISMALECIYACEGNDQLSNAFGILECLPQRGFGIISEVSSKLHNQVDYLECHLSAAEILENHGLPQTISYIRDTQNDPEETKKLFTKLTRVAGRKSPPLTSAEWKKLLVAMLSLRDKAYRCIEPNICYEIFVESLLCSSRPENISLAGEMMECSVAESSEPYYPATDREDTPLLHKVSYKQSVNLVLTAAQEYFNSSAALTDNCMELARQCLSLISDQPPSVVEELDLIESLSLLDGFGVAMLPLQVRMTEERLSLVQKAIDAKPFTYKNSQRLLRLARLLRVQSQNDGEREGKVLKLVAKAALKAKDQRVAHDTCLQLMKDGYAPVWEECKALAQLESFTNIKAKVDLLSFTVIHCTEAMLEPILRAKCLLETQLLYEHLQSSGATARSSVSPTRETSPFSPLGAVKQTQEILTATTSTTKTVLSAVSDKKWWQKTLKSLHPLHHGTYSEEWDDRNAGLLKQGCHPFYGDQIEKPYENISEADYKNMQTRPTVVNGLQTSEALLRMVSLEQMLTEGATEHSATQVLLQLAEDNIYQDCALGLAYLLALPNPLDGESVFSKLPRTAISLQIACYYYSLQIAARLSSTVTPEPASLYRCDPDKVIKHIVEAIGEDGANIKKYKGKTPEGLLDLAEKLCHYHELMIDFTQAQVLDRLGKGVDVARFTQDSAYKRETIIGLAMTTEEHVYNTAITLAKRYKLPLWEIYMTHLEFLFESGLPTAQMEERVTKLGLLHALRKQPADFAKRMLQFVFPTLSGSDHARLMYYYNLLEGCHLEENGGITPETHVRLLKKIKPAAPGIDYKRLMDGSIRPLEVIRPVLNDGNVHVLAKLAPKIPDQHGNFLQPSLVFCAWAVKLFWGLDSKNKPSPQTKSEWIHRYESCGEYIQKLTPDDMIQFIEAIVFVPQALDQLGVECRQEIMRRAIKFSKQGGKKKKQKDENSISSATWEDVVARMQQSLDHLNNFDHPVIAKLTESNDQQLHQYARLFDLSRSEPDKVHELCVHMVLDGQPSSIVSEMLTILPEDSWQPQTAVKEAVSLIIDAIRNPDSECPEVLRGRDLMKTLSSIVKRIQQDQEEGIDLVTSDDVMTLLRPFCADMTIAVQPRLDILHTLEQTFDLGSSDLALLISYRTDAIVSTGWKDRKVSEAEVNTDKARQKLYEGLLSESGVLDQYTALVKLLAVWPPLESLKNSEDDPEKHPWCQLLAAMINKCHEDSLPHVQTTIKDLNDSPTPLSLECTRYIVKKLLENDLPIGAVKCILISGKSELHDKAVSILVDQKQAKEDAALCRLILEHHLVARIVNTLYYPLVVDFVINNQTPGGETPYYLDMESIANQLLELGHEVEAGSLLMAYKGMHPMLRSFDTTFSVLTRWFTR